MHLKARNPKPRQPRNWAACPKKAEEGSHSIMVGCGYLCEFKAAWLVAQEAQPLVSKITTDLKSETAIRLLSLNHPFLLNPPTRQDEALNQKTERLELLKPKACSWDWGLHQATTPS